MAKTTVKIKGELYILTDEVDQPEQLGCAYCALNKSEICERNVSGLFPCLVIAKNCHMNMIQAHFENFLTRKQSILEII